MKNPADDKCRENSYQRPENFTKILHFDVYEKAGRGLCRLDMREYSTNKYTRHYAKCHL